MATCQRLFADLTCDFLLVNAGLLTSLGHSVRRSARLAIECECAAVALTCVALAIASVEGESDTYPNHFLVCSRSRLFLPTILVEYDSFFLSLLRTFHHSFFTHAQSFLPFDSVGSARSAASSCMGAILCLSVASLLGSSLLCGMTVWVDVRGDTVCMFCKLPVERESRSSPLRACCVHAVQKDLSSAFRRVYFLSSLAMFA